MRTDPFTDVHISYFVSLDARISLSNTILAGDRNIQADGHEIQPGLFVVTTNVFLEWTREIHSRNFTVRCGNILFADGHTETLWENLNTLAQRQDIATNRLAIP